MCLNPFAKALAFDRVHDLLGTPLLALGWFSKHAKSLQIEVFLIGRQFESGHPLLPTDHEALLVFTQSTATEKAGSMWHPVIGAE